MSDIDSFVRSIYFLISTESGERNLLPNFFSNIKNILDNIDNDKLNVIMASLNAAYNIFSDSIREKIINVAKSKNIVIVIDDLERISEKLDITDVLGEIYTHFIINGIKVIFIADESMITNEKSKYDIEKEKYIDLTIPFISDKEGILKSQWKVLFNEDIDDVELGVLLKVFYENQTNLRTVRYALGLYKEMIEAFDKNKKNEKNRYDSPTKLLYSLCSYAKFHKKGATDAGKLYYELVNNGYAYLSSNGYSTDEGKKKDEYKKFVEEYSKKDFLISENFLVDFAFGELLRTKELLNYLLKPVKNNEPLYLLQSYQNMETETVKKLLTEVYENLGEQKYSVRDTGLIRDVFIPLSIKKFNMYNKDTIENMFIASTFDEKNKDIMNEMFEFYSKDEFYKFQTFSSTFDSKLNALYSDFLSKKDNDILDCFYKAIKYCKYDNIYMQHFELNNIFNRATACKKSFSPFVKFCFFKDAD